MRHTTRWSAAALLGAAVTIGACGGGNDTRAASVGADSTTAAGEVAANGMAGAAGAMGDSSAMAGAGGAAGMNGANATNLATLSEPDMMALIGASNAGEIATSKAAQPKLTDSEVKSFARRMIDEHTTMQGMADKLATKLNVTPGTPQMATDKKSMANQMAEQLGTAAKGAGLDRQYIDGQVQAHQQTLTELQGMQNTQNAELRTLITTAIPKVQAHLTEAQRLQGKLSQGGAATGASAGTGPGTGTMGGTPNGATGAPRP